MSYTKQNARVPTFRVDSTFQGGTGTATVVVAQAILENVFINDTDPNDACAGDPRKAVRFDFLDASLAGLTVVAAGKTVTYPQLAALLRQACLDRANAQGIT